MRHKRDTRAERRSQELRREGKTMATGSVIKRGNNYSIVYYVDGKQRWKTIGPVKKEAEKALRDIMGQVDRQEYADKTIGFSELAEKWLGSVQAQIKPSSLEFYATIAKHLNEYFKSRQVKTITTADIESYLASKLGGLSNKTVGYHLGVLKQIFNKAKVWRYVYSNPCEGLKRPKIEHKEIQILSSEQIDNLLAVVDGQTRLIILTALRSGLRAGELCALSWGNVDLMAGTIDVKSNYVRGQFTSPKSRGSKRRVVIDAGLVNELVNAKPDSAADDDLVFHNGEGKPLDWTQFLHGGWARALKAAGLTKFTPHGLRHSYASILLAYGEQIAFISKQLGHSNIGITLNTYSHLLPNQETGAGDRIGKAFNDFLGAGAGQIQDAFLAVK